MKLSLFGRWTMAMFASLALGLGMTGCGGGTVGFLWVLGQQYNQIAGFKIDDYTGNLTEIPHAPFTSGGSVPVSLVVKPGGRFLYVINQGTGGTSSAAGAGSNISLFSVGGDGALSFQQAYHTQGFVSQWAQMDSSGSFLYVLDKYSPSGDGDGAITAFGADSTTGRLTLLLNTNIKLSDGTSPTYFEVGASPFMMRTISGCLYTINGADNSIYPYSIGSGGLLNNTTNGFFSPGATTLTSINGSGSLVYLTDSGANYIYQYTIGTNCALTATTGSRTANLTGTSAPMYSLSDATGKYLYVLNQSTTSTSTSGTYSSISAFTIDQTNHELTAISGAPYSVGSGPVCMVEDSTSQYMYISNRNDGTVTGKIFDPRTGILAPLNRGSTFTAAGQAGCLDLSGNVD